ncbi:hypothetical protein IWQ62_003218 [Dispira parvispora]|uniref:KH type-2 domain-containing protein n=1 Tax=Dispira parvispora TaxID=1520584 RepID=A0A9W8E792_9FUNG|nr:hypothetical protein IWQ62_003218 [Dispira parvispora]
MSLSSQIRLRLPKVDQPFKQPRQPHLLRTVLLGPANAGKSTLVNQLVGRDVTVVAPIAQTTRKRVMAAMTRGNKQVVFLDTPGVVVSSLRHKVHRELVTSPWTSLDEAEHALLVIDAYKAIYHTTVAEDEIFRRLKSREIPATLVMNKMDLFKNSAIVEEVAQHYQGLYPLIRNTFYLSATAHSTINPLRQELLSLATPQPWLVSPSFHNDLPELTQVEDVIRAELFTRLRGYIPYIIQQKNHRWEEVPGEEHSTLYIEQILYVDNVRQKKIVVGKDGSLVKEAAFAARKRISRLFQLPVILSLVVKVKNTYH